MAVLLIVEDESVLRSSMVRGLSKLPDLTIIEAGTIQQALALLRSSRPSLIISDLDLPDGSGVELVNAMDRVGMRAPIIYISAYLDRYRSRVPSRSDIDMCEKPIRLEALRQLVQSRIAKAVGAGPPPFNIEEYIQLACMGQHSILIKIEKDDRALGQVVVRAGELWSADDAQGSGEDALRRLLSHREIRVACQTLREQVGPRTIGAKPWVGILLEAAKHRDEVTRDSDRAAPAVDPPSTLVESWDSDLNRLIDEEISRAASTAATAAPQPSIPAQPPPASGAVNGHDFDRLVAEGVDAALEKDYVAALRAFLSAEALRPDDPIVRTNLRRLRELGVT